MNGAAADAKSPRCPFCAVTRLVRVGIRLDDCVGFGVFRSCNRCVIAGLHSRFPAALRRVRGVRPAGGLPVLVRVGHRDRVAFARRVPVETLKFTRGIAPGSKISRAQRTASSDEHRRNSICHRMRSLRKLFRSVKLKDTVKLIDMID